MSPCSEFFSSELFERVQLLRVFDDSKSFADAVPRHSYAKALAAYDAHRPSDDELHLFVKEHFSVRQIDIPDTARDVGSLRSFIENTWDKLIRPPDKMNNESSLLPLPYRYLVPGGRFQEIYYWDTYFTALGLVESKQHRLVKEMLDNFVHLQQTYGLIPNGNRAYYLSRSQPPILALLVKLLGKHMHNFDAQHYLPNLIQEYEFWTSGHDNPRSVETKDGFIASRYWDNSTSPRPESLFEDIGLAKGLNEPNRKSFFRNLRAACESGWDFSSRWLPHSDDLTSINTTAILPVDLNALLAISEQTISDIARDDDQISLAQKYEKKRALRKRFFHEHFWQSDRQGFFDINIDNLSSTEVDSLACVVPLFAQLATPEQAHQIANAIETKFLYQGGLTTTLNNTQQQWDFPNAWAPLQWFAVDGLLHYGYKDLAQKIAHAWLGNVEAYFTHHGVMMEKYNAEDLNIAARGGEYEVQLGFGWTNGVTLKLDTLFK